MQRGTGNRVLQLQTKERITLYDYGAATVEAGYQT